MLKKKKKQTTVLNFPKKTALLPKPDVIIFIVVLDDYI